MYVPVSICQITDNLIVQLFEYLQDITQKYFR